MPEIATNDIKVHLQKIEDLFVDPDTNPFENPRLSVSGIQDILNQMRPLPMDEPLSFSIYLPPEGIEPGLSERTKEALGRYCEFQARNLDLEVQSTKTSGRRALGLGLLGSLVCIVLGVFSYYVYGVYGVSPLGILGLLFGSLFSLASWVIVWNPLDTLFYGWRPTQREARMYRKIAQSDLRILPES